MAAKNPTSFDPEANLPFWGYRRFVDNEKPVADMVQSLAHFYESEKFRGVDEALRAAVLDSRTAKEARKITKRHSTNWRKDWKAVRGRVFRAGLAMQVMQSRTALRMARAAFGQSIEVAAVPRIGGIPGSFISAELATFFQAPTSGPEFNRLGVIALNGCVPDDIEQRLDALFAAKKPVSAAVYTGGDADHRIEMWCAEVAVPIRLTSMASSRLREEDAFAVTERINNLIYCMPKARKASQAILKAASLKRPRIKLLDLTAVPGN